MQKPNSVNFQSNSLEHLEQLSIVNMKEEIKARISEKVSSYTDTNQFDYHFSDLLYYRHSDASNEVDDVLVALTSYCLFFDYFFEARQQTSGKRGKIFGKLKRFLPKRKALFCIFTVLQDSSRRVSRADGGEWRSLCINIGSSEPTGAESREGTSTRAESSRVT